MTSILKVDTIQDADGNNIINESSNTITVGASGDTVALGSGALQSNLLTPIFSAYSNANQTGLTQGAYSKITLNAEYFDSDGAFDVSNYRFTPTTAGKYFVYSTLHCNATAANNFLLGTTTIKKNGSNIIYSQMDQRTTGNGYSNAVCAFGVVDMNGSSDYLESWGYVSSSGGTQRISGNSSAQYSLFGAYKIIE